MTHTHLKVVLLKLRHFPVPSGHPLVLSLAGLVKKRTKARGAAHATGAGLLGLSDLGLESELRFLSHGEGVVMSTVRG